LRVAPSGPAAALEPEPETAGGSGRERARAQATERPPEAAQASGRAPGLEPGQATLEERRETARVAARGSEPARAQVPEQAKAWERGPREKVRPVYRVAGGSAADPGSPARWH